MKLLNFVESKELLTKCCRSEHPCISDATTAADIITTEKGQQVVLDDLFAHNPALIKFWELKHTSLLISGNSQRYQLFD